MTITESHTRKLLDAALEHLALERAAACVLPVLDTDPPLFVAVGPAAAIVKLLQDDALASPELPDLDPCPFCGNKAEMADNGTGSWRVACLQSKGGCGATGRMTFDGGATAAREWNRRAQPEGEAIPGKQAVFAIDLMGSPMREYAPGKWENAIWPSEQPEGEAPQAVATLRRFWMGYEWAGVSHAEAAEIEAAFAALTAPAAQHAESGAPTHCDPAESFCKNCREQERRHLAAQSQGAQAAPGELPPLPRASGEFRGERLYDVGVMRDYARAALAGRSEPLATANIEFDDSEGGHHD